MKLLEGKIALITGAAQGIGRSIALEFAKNGADILFTDIRADERSEAVTNELKAFGVRAEFFAADASSLEQTQELGKTIAEKYGRVDVLVNYTKVFSAMMMRQRNGSIINMSSIVGVNGNAGQCNYSASKAGIIGFTKSVAKELGSRNIRSNAIAPGFIQTAMTGKLSEEVIEEWKKRIPMRRPGLPEDIAKLALFLASDLSEYVTGQVICCDGGLALG